MEQTTRSEAEPPVEGQASEEVVERPPPVEGQVSEEVVERPPPVERQASEDMDDDEVISTAEQIASLITTPSLPSRPKPLSKCMSVGRLSLDKSKPITPTQRQRQPVFNRSASSSNMLPSSRIPLVVRQPVFARSSSSCNMLPSSRIPLVVRQDGKLAAVKKPIGELLPKHTAEERAALASQPAPHDPHFKKTIQTMGLLPIPNLQKQREKETDVFHHETAEGMTLVLAVPVHHDKQSVSKAAPTNRGRDSYATAPYGETYILSARCPTTGIDRYIKFII